MITGDHAVTAEAIARQLGIRGRAVLGSVFAAMGPEEVSREIDTIGVIARVAPEDKVHLVDVLKAKGDVVAMTGDGVNDAPALKKADIGVAMGITGTEVSKEAAVMILTDDNFATIVKAVELGRALYDNLMRYIRFQMAALFGFIATFLGASLLNIAGGVPFLPLQTLWINFTVQIFLAIGLGYGKAREGLMQDAPRSPEQRILPRRLMAWVIVGGLVMAATTLGVIAWATPVYGPETARTMGFVVFSLGNIWFALETSDETRSIFNPDALPSATLLKAAGGAFLATVLGTELGVLNRLLDTVNLELNQWAIAIIVSLAVIVLAEGRKALGIHTIEPPTLVVPAVVPAT
ncbi:MAG: HAD-IC family P-type ATPase, partial [Chloroflexota bacterium]